jgi:tetratricopeptide (TPR) repeat protein
MTDTLLADNRVRIQEWTQVFELMASNMEDALGREGDGADPRLYIRLGKAYNERSFLEPEYIEDGERALRRAVALAPKRPDGYYELGVNLLQRGENDAAIKTFQDAVELNPKNSRSYWTLGLALVISQRYEEGLAALEKAIDEGYGWMNPGDIGNLAQVYTITQQYGKLVSMYEKVAQMFPEAQYYASLATAYAQVGEIQKAIEAAQKAAQLDERFAGEAENFIQLLRRGTAAER